MSNALHTSKQSPLLPSYSLYLQKGGPIRGPYICVIFRDNAFVFVFGGKTTTWYARLIITSFHPGKRNPIWPCSVLVWFVCFKFLRHSNNPCRRPAQESGCGLSKQPNGCSRNPKEGNMRYSCKILTCPSLVPVACPFTVVFLPLQIMPRNTV